jgi:MFS family permease
MKKVPLFIERLYDFINKEQGQRICTDITEEACNFTPYNYFIILISNTLTKLGDTLSNPKTVIAWIMSVIDVPVSLISFVVPIRESGSMLPQIVIASFIRTKKIRKWVWVAGSVLQFISIGLIGLIGMKLEGLIAGWLIIFCLILFSISRGLCSVASKDVTGKAIPKTRRGKLKGFTVSVSGILTLLAGMYMINQSQENQGVLFYTYILFFASSMWLIAAIVFAGIKEFPGTIAEGSSDWKDAVKKLSLIKTDIPFRNFIIARSLLFVSALSAPFYVLLAQEYQGKSSKLLGLFIIANGLAAIISAPFWGKLADQSSRKVMSLGAIIASLLGIFMFFVIVGIPILRDGYWTYPIIFFLLGIAHSGVRIGRKTYILDMAKGNKRTDYVAVSNTIIGAILLLAGGVSALASIFSVEGILLVLSVLGIIGAYKSWQLIEVE